MATLKQYWSDEVTRIGNALAAAGSDADAQRGTVLAAEANQRDVAETVRASGEALAAARRALAGIPMPADGNPLLAQMESALVALRAAQAALANGQERLLVLRGDLQRAEQKAQGLAAELAAAKAALDRETVAGQARQDLSNKLSTGSLANLVNEADDVLSTHKATANARVEGEFPTSATASQDFLGRVRARRALVASLAASAATVEYEAWIANDTALAKAQRDFNATVAVVQETADAAVQLATDATTLARLAALPAPNPPTSYSILTRWQHDRLHDADKQSQREAALAKLTAVDEARQAVLAVQEAYDKALHAAMKAEPDKTVAQLDATTLSAERTALDGKLTDLETAHNDYTALSADDRHAIDNWFAAVPDPLWEALDALDGAVARLEKLKGPPTPADLVTAMNNAEAALETALRGAREAQRKAAGGQDAWQRASVRVRAAHDTVAGRAIAMSRGSALF